MKSQTKLPVKTQKLRWVCSIFTSVTDYNPGELKSYDWDYETEYIEVENKFYRYI